ncbi:MAG: hypothetical protein HWN68_17460 [Desulfobacterales bacterium]|nr:hypothetical protein [Desulfobacterales bacterium]
MNKLSQRVEGISEELWDKVNDDVIGKMIGYREVGVKKTKDELLEEFKEYEKYWKTREAFEYWIRFCFWFTRSDRRLNDFHDFLRCEELRLEKKSYSEISRITGISKSRVHRLLSDENVIRWTAKDGAEWLGIPASAVRRIWKEDREKRSGKIA